MLGKTYAELLSKVPTNAEKGIVELKTGTRKEIDITEEWQEGEGEYIRRFKGTYIHNGGTVEYIDILDTNGNLIWREQVGENWDSGVYNLEINIEFIYEE